MPTECNPKSFEFAPVEGRAVVAAFDGGTITSDAGALLLGATDRAIGLVERFAGCVDDHRDPGGIEHSLPTLVGQRVFAMALGYEDLIDHDAHIRARKPPKGRLCPQHSPLPQRSKPACHAPHKRPGDHRQAPPIVPAVLTAPSAD